MDYTEFASKLLQEFNEVQNKFRDQFKIDDYSNWFYDQATELLTLSNESEEINFKYIPIGTFSKETETWMWAWNNESSIEKSKEKTLQIKTLGEERNYKKLIEGHFDSDIYDGWEFIAIANKLLNGIGGYKVNTNHLEKYLLIIEHINLETANKIKEQTIDCESHGANRIAFVCQHLIKAKNKGFEEAFPTKKGMELGEEDDFQAWCDECEKERLKKDGWNEESMKFADIKLICEECYFELKEKNLKVQRINF